MEEQMKAGWIIKHGNDSNETMPKFEYYSLENHFFIHYFKYATICCQGQAFCWGFVFQFLDYKRFGFMITAMYGICLPVDTLIFYKEIVIISKHKTQFP